MNSTQSDYLIVGGGSAGAVLASRLSEDPSRRVVLLESGRDTPPGGTPADIADTFPSSTLNPAYFWPALEATLVEGGSVRPFPQARIMGGGSSIMGMLALRGVPGDYARWTERGAAPSWDEALRLFRQVETGKGDADGRRRCAYPITPTPTTDWPAYVRAMRSAALAKGFDYIDDINETPRDGFFSMPTSRDASARSSSARCYLDAEVRARPNLTIRTETFVTRVLFAGRQAVGVEAAHGGGVERHLAGRVVVCAGGIFSPTILMRSGVGPESEVARHGIATVAVRPGVGRNLQNHSYSFFSLTLPRGKRMASHLRRFTVAGLRASSGLADCPTSDLLLYMTGRVSGRSFGPDVALLASAVYSPFSTGAVTLASADPRVYPRIDFRMLSDTRDRTRVVIAARLAESLLRDPEVAACYGEASLLPSGMALNQFNRPGLRGSLFGAGVKAVLNSPGVIRRAAMRHGFPGARPLVHQRRPAHISDDELLASLAPMGHPSGTCAMGPADDPAAVVDTSYQVHGVERLFVVDASVMPSIPSANTNLPTLMLAERAAERLMAIS